MKQLKFNNFELKNLICKVLNQENIKVENNHIIDLLIEFSQSDIRKLIDLLKVFRIPYIFSKSESDMLCGRLSQLNKIDYVLSNDTDLLLFGCKKLIKFENKKVYCYDLNKILI